MAVPTSTLADEFPRATDPFRSALFAHCYRMLGSVHDAEDLVQETYLRAWRAYDRFEGRSSVRSWLFRIATHACLTALETRGRRPLPRDLGGPEPEPGSHAAAERSDVPWLQPLPDSAAGVGGDPASIVLHRESTRLAFIAALQHLPPRQRTVLILRDVMGLRASEVAEILDTTSVAVNSVLQRTRAQLDRIAPREEQLAEPADQDQKQLLDRYVDAFENHDVPGITALFHADATWEMPPFTAWYRGVDTIGRHLATQCPTRAGELRLLPTRANGQPAFATYLRGEDGRHHASAIQVLTVEGGRIGAMTMFFDLRLFPVFGLPDTLPE
ncbi:sigma-70 family RNA polymerase sigma factor [Streptomyces amakusaensis]|uniref:RNA polymerase sigma factor n=1 Tax=Streptomyces amakusaensis TaxID=67271 RepID=A0ABW0A9A4_9ACTN